MNKLLRNIALLLLLLLVGSPTFAQNKKDKIGAAKVAFISQKLNLSTSEAQLFWPVYNEEQDKYEALREKRKEFRAIKENLEGATDKEIDTYLALEISIKQKELEIQKEYHEKIRKIIGARKLAALYKAEDDFKKELLKQLKENK